MREIIEKELGWDNFIKEIQEHEDCTNNIKVLCGIYWQAYNTDDYNDNCFNECCAEDIGLCYEIRQFAVNTIVDIILKGEK